MDIREGTEITCVIKLGRQNNYVSYASDGRIILFDDQKTLLKEGDPIGMTAKAVIIAVKPNFILAHVRDVYTLPINEAPIEKFTYYVKKGDGFLYRMTPSKEPWYRELKSLAQQSSTKALIHAYIQVEDDDVSEN
jgi:hypothetical protein